MNAPIRIQRRRTKGWKMPDNTVSVTRPGKYGNPYYPGCALGFGNIDMIDGRARPWRLETPADAVRHFREHMRLFKRDEPRRYEEHIAPLRGKNLACWCKSGASCHADVLLELASAPICEAA
ncbi:DUF4326 domain-containing protein [Bradyrhizobium sp. PMVTL-01]|uniref:DUF4326 domain-containing protein n=1 Tax=Bradyrhizobium sp. PMVTL-01 TaxID=3434999 RepID=UPI003F728B1F